MDHVLSLCLRERRTQDSLYLFRSPIDLAYFPPLDPAQNPNKKGCYVPIAALFVAEPYGLFPDDPQGAFSTRNLQQIGSGAQFRQVQNPLAVDLHQRQDEPSLEVI